jgi:hypothetical protein
MLGVPPLCVLTTWASGGGGEGEGRSFFTPTRALSERPPDLCPAPGAQRDNEEHFLRESQMNFVPSLQRTAQSEAEITQILTRLGLW